MLPIQLFREATSKNTKTSVITPIHSVLLIFAAALVFGVHYNLPVEYIKLIAIILTIVVILYFIFYAICFFTDKDALRSESFVVQKMAIERGLLGDNSQGIIVDSKGLSQVALQAGVINGEVVNKS